MDQVCRLAVTLTEELKRFSEIAVPIKLTPVCVWLCVCVCVCVCHVLVCVKSAVLFSFFPPQLQSVWLRSPWLSRQLKFLFHLGVINNVDSNHSVFGRVSSIGHLAAAERLFTSQGSD